MWLAEKCPRPLLMSRGAALLAVLMVSRSLADFTVLSLSGPASPVSAPHCLAQLHQFQQYFQCTWYCTGVEEYTWEVKPPTNPHKTEKCGCKRRNVLGHIVLFCVGAKAAHRVHRHRHRHWHWAVAEARARGWCCQGCSTGTPLVLGLEHKGHSIINMSIVTC